MTPDTHSHGGSDPLHTPSPPEVNQAEHNLFLALLENPDLNTMRYPYPRYTDDPNVECHIRAFVSTSRKRSCGEKKKLRLLNMRKRPSRRTTMEDKGQADLKGVTHDEISTKKEGSNVRTINSNTRLYDESELRI